MIGTIERPAAEVHARNVAMEEVSEKLGRMSREARDMIMLDAFTSEDMVDPDTDEDVIATALVEAYGPAQARRIADEAMRNEDDYVAAYIKQMSRAFARGA